MYALFKQKYDNKTSDNYQFLNYYLAYEIWINKLCIDVSAHDNIWLRYYLKYGIWGLKKKSFTQYVQTMFLAMLITNQKLSFEIFTNGNLLNIMELDLYLILLCFFVIKEINKSIWLNWYNCFLDIAINIPMQHKVLWSLVTYFKSTITWKICHTKYFPFQHLWAVVPRFHHAFTLIILQEFSTNKPHIYVESVEKKWMAQPAKYYSPERSINRLYIKAYFNTKK